METFLAFLFILAILAAFTIFFVASMTAKDKACINLMQALSYTPFS